MKGKKILITLLAVIILAGLVTGLVLAANVVDGGDAGFVLDSSDDGALFTRNLSRTPNTMTNGAQISVMPLYVTAQDTQGAAIELEYLLDDRTTVAETLTEAKPLIATYEDGIVDEELNEALGITSIETGTGFGERDAYGAISLSDGQFWKDTNLSNSADRSSFVLRTTGEAYPGDVFRINHVVVGNRVAVAWISRYCESGSPLYSWADEDKDALEAAYPELLNPIAVVDATDPYEMYTDDLFGVAGTQKSVDYTLQGFPEVGEIPYGCVWVARGTLEADPDLAGAYDIIWRQAERLTSGRRDANRVDITGTSGAGFIVSWQEDPDGLRPGKGLGPGEGWSGAIANSKTDIWYSYIGWDHFDDVYDVDAIVDPSLGDANLFAIADAGKPKIVVPFAMPIRLTDNNQCKANGLSDPYCYADFNDVEGPDLCAESVTWTKPLDNSGTLEICVAEDGRAMTGRTASTRVRWALKPYTTAFDNDNDGSNDVSAWVVMAEEKMKAMGDPDLPDDEDPIDVGKDMWYHTFEFNNPEIAQQGLMLNSPAIDHETGEFFEITEDEFENPYYETEIARRFNLMVQGTGSALASDEKTSAILIYKEGILNQGGPADIFIRRVEIDEATFDATTDNPFAYENVVCDAFDGAITPSIDGTPTEWLYTDGSNPNYVRGLCTVQGVNISGTSIVSCETNSDGLACAEAFPWDAEAGDSDYDKVYEWRQCDGIDTSIPDCIAGESNFDDPSWANPYDVSKGHRGFIDGDFVMMMYATAPNWKANTTGNEAYNLYVRRSFDGGQTWTTLPASFTHINTLTYSGLGTDTCEWYGWGGQDETEVCTHYNAGEFEQARNVSLLTGSRITVLDPRYSPTGGMLKTDITDLICDLDANGVWENCLYTVGNDGATYPQDVRAPSAFFVTYEVGDNTVVDVDTAAPPMDMYYSRATNFGDLFDVVTYYSEATNTFEDGPRWDWLENGDEIASEASVYANPNASKFYTVWNQELEIAPEVFTDIDVEFRRIYYNYGDDDYAPTSSILYVSSYVLDQSADDVLRLVGTGRDWDRLGDGPGITAYAWFDKDLGTIYCKWEELDDEDVEAYLECEQELEKEARDMGPGWANFSFKAQDNEGRWSPTVEVNVMVFEQIASQIYLPILER